MGLLKDAKEQFEIYRVKDPAIRSYWDVLLYPCFWAMRTYRKAHKLWESGHYFRARLISQRMARKTGIEIHPGAQIGKNLFIDHGAGVVIGETTIIGDNCILYQGVTLGGTGKEHGKRHPTLGNGVMVCSGAKLLGSFSVGDNAKIGAGAVVLKPVPPNCTVVGVPGRIVRMKNKVVPTESMDQTNLPDPILEDLKILRRSNNELINRLMEMEQEVRAIKKVQAASPCGRAGDVTVPEEKPALQPLVPNDECEFEEVGDCLFADYI
ncbi:MAG: serine O-acetyltransferase [Lachnospiraceae bacterium]|nr:serine O-acetyltransferase [Lachnospiraceae bacterium]